MENIATIKFIDLDINREAYAIVRSDGSCIALCLTIKSHGDLEVALDKTGTASLLEALKNAIVYDAIKEPVVIKCKDIDMSDEALVIVRRHDTTVVVGLSLKSDGDMQVAMRKEDAQRLIDALLIALKGRSEEK
jgi:hypothetical protein